MSELLPQVPLNSPRFGSLTLYVAVDEKNISWRVPGKKLANWIEEFNRCWKERSGINEGRNLTWLYNRTVTLKGYELQRCLEELGTLNKTVISQSLGLNWYMTLNDFEEISASGIEIYKDLDIKTITVLIAEDNKEIVNEELVNKICEVIAGGIGVNFVGDLRLLRDTTLFERYEFNTSPTTMIHREFGTTQVSGRKGRRRSCKSRIHWVVGATGHIYPCLGLAGLKNCRVGHVDDDIHALFSDNRNEDLDLTKLINDGPEVPEFLETDVQAGVALDCYFHRQALENLKP